MNHKALALLAALSFSFFAVTTTRARDINPVLLSTFPPPVGGTTTDVAASGNLVYVCEGEKGLTILDASNPSSPQFVGSVDTPGFASAIALSGNLALIADNTFGLQIIDISNPSAPNIIGSYDTPGTANAVVTADRLAYVADGSYGLQIIDFTIPSQPVRVGGYNTFGNALSVAASGDYAYVADADNGLVVIDVSIPANAHRVAGYDRLPATHITIAGNDAYVSGPGPLVTFDISNPLDPQPISSVDLPGNVTASTVSGNTTYVTSGVGGFHILDTTDPFAPRVLGSSSVITNATRVVTSDSLAFVADLTNGVRVFAASNPAVMDVVAHIPIPGVIRNISDVVISGDYLYMTDGSADLTFPNHLWIVNISQPADMRVIATGQWGGSRIAVFDKYVALYSPGSFNELNIIAVADPANPASLSSASNGPLDAQGFGSYLVQGGFGGLQVDAMSPSAGLQNVGALNVVENGTISGIWALAVKDTTVWALLTAMSTSDSLFRIDLSTPSHPNVLNSSPAAYNVIVGATQMAVSDTNGFFLTFSQNRRQQQLHVFDSESLAEVTERDVTSVKRFAANTNTVYLAKGSLGVEVLRLDGATLTSVGGAGLPNVTAITTSKDYVFVAGTNGLYVLTHYQPTVRLEASINTNQIPQLSLFAPIGSAGRIQRATTLTTNSFQDWQTVQINSSPQILTDTNSQTAFYRFVSP